jgi:hypothetical protein
LFVELTHCSCRENRFDSQVGAEERSNCFGQKASYDRRSPWFRRRHVQVHVVDRCALVVLLNFQREHRITISMFVEKPIDLMHNRTANATYYEAILEHAARSGRTVGTVMFFQSFVFCLPINNDFFLFFIIFFYSYSI